MKLLLPPALFSFLLLGSCSNDPQPTDSTTKPNQSVVEEAAVPVAKAGPGILTELSGAVVETMNSGGYTYALVDNGSEKVWAAGPMSALKVGEEVVVNGLIPMRDFKSTTLDRTFETIYFCNTINVAGAQPTSRPVATEEPAETDEPVSVEQAEGGQTIEQIFTGKDDLVGKEVVIHAKVVKFSPAIMGKNWLHLQDGTGGEGTNDLTITTDQSAAVGDVVTVRGVLVADKDFGYGYKYALIVEDAQVSVD